MGGEVVAAHQWKYICCILTMLCPLSKELQYSHRSMASICRCLIVLWQTLLASSRCFACYLDLLYFRDFGEFPPRYRVQPYSGSYCNDEIPFHLSLSGGIRVVIFLCSLVKICCALSASNFLYLRGSPKSFPSSSLGPFSKESELQLWAISP